jgi:hypothetical protein
MSVGFANIVEEVKQLSSDEKEELFGLLNAYLIEEKRQSILESYQESKKEAAEGRLTFSSKIDDLEAMLND